jgi:molecular chaperone GrpE
MHPGGVGNIERVILAPPCTATRRGHSRFDRDKKFIHNANMSDDDVIIDTEDSDEGMSEEELEASESRAESKIERVKQELATCKKEKQEYLDGWQRAKADYVNALKRFDEDVSRAKTGGMVKTAEAFIPVMDSLARASAQGDIPEGFQAIMKQLENAGKTVGLSSFGAIGEAFDPNLHEALGQDPTEEASADDTISQVLEKGWKVQDVVVRPAMVRVFSKT